MGYLGGLMWYGSRGLLQSRWGQKRNAFEGLVRVKSPSLATSFALWGGMFSAFDCLLMKGRKREDPANALMSGALTGFTSSIRSGPRYALKQALQGSSVLCLIEGVTFLSSRKPGISPREQFLKDKKKRL